MELWVKTDGREGKVCNGSIQIKLASNPIVFEHKYGKKYLMIKEQFLNLDLFIPVYYYFVHEKVKYNDFCDSPCI